MSVKTYLKIAKDLDINIALLGAHGRSKTSQVKEYAEEIGYQLNTIILSQIVPEDLIGLPLLSEDKKTTVNALPKWADEACSPKKKIILFFDEFSNAEKDVQSSILNLLESREICGKHLNKNTQIILAFNPNSIAPTGKTLSKATRDRICIIPVKDNIKEFTDYYKSIGRTQLASALKTDGFIKNYDLECEDSLNENAELTWRSAVKIDDIVKYCLQNNFDEEVIETLAVGYCGNAVRSFVSELLDLYANEDFTLSSVCSILEGYKKGIDETFVALQEIELTYLEKYNRDITFTSWSNIIEVIKDELPKKEWDNFYKSIVKNFFDKEFVTKFSF